MITLLLILQAFPDPSAWPSIIKAVKDPFSLLALIVLVLGNLGYRAARDAKASVRLIAFFIIVVALTGLGLNVMRVINVQTTGKVEAAEPTLDASIVFRGSHKVLTPVTVPFQVGSGQVNFGCGDSAHPVVSYNAPSSARDINATAQWVNTSNVKGQDQRAAVTGTTVTAYGNITGLDRDWIGNCPGGGHGELLLRGTYIIDEPSATEPVTKTIRAALTPGSNRTFELPNDADQITESCEITVASEKGTYGHALLRLRKEGAQTVAEVVEQSGKIEASVANGELVLRVD